MSDSLIAELIELAHILSEHPARLVIWEEGALALRVSDASYAVTRRNASLSALAPEDLVHLDHQRMVELAGADMFLPEDLAAALLKPDSPAPNINALVFACLLNLEGVRFAAHIHPIAVDQITASPRARQFAERRTLFNETQMLGATLMLVPYADPGLPFAKEMQRKMMLWRDRYRSVPRTILVQNNGVIFLGASAREIVRNIELLIKYAEVFVGASVLGGPVYLTPQNIMSIEAIRER
jgi:rhamnose utilization protein RhaD (predicted bifunctional aldolase and dehydrogenase)